MKLIALLHKYHIRQLFFPNIISIFINPLLSYQEGDA
jgi:hypothetical protein